MVGIELDTVDRTILHLLQEGARTVTAEEMGEVADVSASTVRNRIEKLEQAGVIQDYHPQIDYAQAGYHLHLFIICRVPRAERAARAEDALDIVGTVTVREMLTGSNNLHIEAVAEDASAVDTISEKIESLDLEITSIEVVKETHVQPFDHFGPAPQTNNSDQ
ncbi:Lrp/AsnC family transcriptional regulator [Halohasta litorea]|uniref:Lrp/AsnC family transcriptional regulator n=1 Tax=Halohasta litorea TaxID=869891 RepID=A0ABD6D9B8_9EURY|nr:Lrp/AsnC family transcriptional regulator [Halohasta litorea]